MTTDEIIAGLAAVLVAGVLAQWLAWRFNLPSILLLLFAGLLAGPGLGILDPEKMIGADFIPLVSISVAVILYEGGLSLNFRELSGLRGPVIGLVTIGAFATWVLLSLFAWAVLGLNEPIAILLGAILIVSGPTVVQPLLLHIRPTDAVGSVLKWEGIFIDPIGAIAAVVTVHTITEGLRRPSVFGLDVLFGVSVTIIVGGVLGAIAAVALAFLMKSYQIPDYLLNPVSLAMVVGVFAISDAVRSESGLFAVTIMGVVMTNQTWVSIREIIEFKENLRVLIISLLFILLSAQLTRDDIRAVLTWHSFVFLAIIVLLARPIATALSTARSSLNWHERGFIAWMAPRGIVAASVASIFGLQLEDLGVEDADLVVPFTFFIIITTVVIYGTTAGPVAGLLGVKGPEPNGFLMLGINSFTMELAAELQKHKLPVLLIDTDQESIQQARLKGLPTYYGNLLIEETLFEIDLNGIGKLFAVTSFDSVNSLAVLSMREVFDRQYLYRVAPREEEQPGLDGPTQLDVPGRIIVDEDVTYDDLLSKFEIGADIRSTPLTDEFHFVDYQRQYESRATPVMLIRGSGTARVFTTDRELTPEVGDTIIGIVVPEEQTQTVPEPEEQEFASFGHWQADLEDRKQPEKGVE